MKAYYLLVSALSVCITPSYSQFFYSHYTPLPQISPFFPQTFLPTLPAISPLAYTAPQNQPASTSTSSVTYNIPQNPTAEFRGFGYRTDYNDGASSTVFYVTGPEAQHLRNFKDIPNFMTRTQDNTAGKARSLASDLTDINAIPNAEDKIQSILQPTDFQKIFDSLMPGIVNFYSFPAGTVPLALARQLLNSTNTTTTTQAPDETVAAESVVNSKIIINDVDNIIKNNGTSEETTTTTTTTTTSTEATSTTEAIVESKSAETLSTTESIEESNEKTTASSTEENSATETATEV